MKTTIITESVISDDDDPIFAFTADNERVIVVDGVTLSGEVPITDNFEELSNLQAVINGTLQGYIAVDLYAGHLTIGTSGQLFGRYAAFYGRENSNLVNNGLLQADHAVKFYDHGPGSNSVVNRGTIVGEIDGIEFAGFGEAEDATVINHGIIRAGEHAPRDFGYAITSFRLSTTVVNDGSILVTDRGGVAIGVHGDEWSTDDYRFLLNNSGTITSTHGRGVFTSQGVASTIVNNGTISGASDALDLSYDADIVQNDGHLNGRVRLGGGNDSYYGENGQVSGPVVGQAGSDLLMGGAFAEILDGGSGSDTVIGGGGNDLLTGAAGMDVISGGAGDDIFRFMATSDARGDRIIASAGIAAFEGAGTPGGDRIDVSAIDADASLAGHQQFIFGSSHAVGHLWAIDVGRVTHIQGNTGGDSAPEFQLVINDGAGVHASDYAAIDFIL